MIVLEDIILNYVVKHLVALHVAVNLMFATLKMLVKLVDVYGTILITSAVLLEKFTILVRENVFMIPMAITLI